MSEEEEKKEESESKEEPKEPEAPSEEEVAEEAKEEPSEPAEPVVDEGEAEEKEELESEESKTENQEAYPYPSLKLSEVLKVALSQVLKNADLKDEDKKALSNLLKAAIGKYPAVKSSPAMATSETEKATELLEEASAKLESQSTEMEVLKDENRKYKKKVEEIEKKEKNSAVEGVLKKEVMMGVLSEEDKEAKAEVYRKLSLNDLKKMSENLKDKKVVEVKKEALKGEETKDKVDENLEEKKRLMRQAGISEETIKELYEKEDDSE